MKIASLKPILIAALLFALCLLLGGCSPVLSREAVAGTYRLKHQAGMIELVLRPDESFTETIRPVRGPVTLHKGTWSPPSSQSPQIGLNGLCIPREFTPDHVLAASEGPGGNGFKHGEPGYWVGSPGSWFGSVVIEIFPDDDIKFEQISRQWSAK